MKIGIVINFVAFQLIWLLCVFGAAWGYPWIGPVAVTAWLLVHLKLHRAIARQELMLAVFAALMGYGLDSILVVLDIIRFPAPAQLGYPSTLWMVSLWINLALTIRHSLAWLNHHYVWISLFGGVGGALAYWAGERIGAISFNDLSLGLIMVFSIWFFALPVVYLVSNWLEQRASNEHDQLKQPMKESRNNA